MRRTRLKFLPKFGERSDNNRTNSGNASTPKLSTTPSSVGIVRNDASSQEAKTETPSISRPEPTNNDDNISKLSLPESKNSEDDLLQSEKTNTPPHEEELPKVEESNNKVMPIVNNKQDSPEKLSTPSPLKRTRLPKAQPNLVISRKPPSKPTENEAFSFNKSPPPVQRLLKLPLHQAKDSALDLDLIVEKDRTVDAQKGQSFASEDDTSQKENESCAEKHQLAEKCGAVPAPTSNTAPKRSAPIAPNSTGRKNTAKSQRKDVAKRQHNKKQGDGPPDRVKMTMYDLIYWNPSTNPMMNQSNDSEAEIVQEIQNEEQQNKELAKDAPTSTNDKPQTEETNDDNADNDDAALPVPQVKIGPDGNIILDDKSLVIETTASKNNLSDSPIVYEKTSTTTYASFRKARRAKLWSNAETVKFYKVLSSVGVDFSMMANFFPNRSRHELKLKFKKEDRVHRDLIDKVIHYRQEFDFSLLEETDAASGANKGSNPENSTKEKGRKKRAADKNDENLNSDSTGNRCRRVSSQGKKKKLKRAEACKDKSEDSDVVSENEEQTKQPNALKMPPLIQKQFQPSNTELLLDPDNPANANDPATMNRHLNRINFDELPSNASSSNATLPYQEQSNDSEGLSSDSEVEILKSVSKPTRSGRQPKKPDAFVSREENKMSRKPRQKRIAIINSPVSNTSYPETSAVVDPAAVTALPVNEELGRQMREIILHSTPQLATACSSQDRLLFVPTPSKTGGEQVIHVYMLSPVAQSPPQPSASMTPPRTSSLSPAQLKTVHRSPLSFGHRFTMSPVAPVLNQNIATQFVGPNAQGGAETPLRVKRIYVPNVAAAKGPRQTVVVASEGEMPKENASAASLPASNE